MPIEPRPPSSWAAAVLPLLRPAADRLPEQIVARIAAEVPALRGRSQMRRVVKEAVAVGVCAFLDGAAMPQATSHFADIGRARAEASTNLVPVLQALQVASGVVWETLHRLARDEALNGQLVAEIGAAITGHLSQLGHAAERGHSEARRARCDARGALFSALMGRRADQEVAELAQLADWSVPQQVVVLVAELRGTLVAPVADVPSDVLLQGDGDRLVAVCPTHRADLVRQVLLSVGPQVMVAEAWPVPLAEARHGYRWARRALGLVRERQLRHHGRLVRCADHRFDLWLHADPALAGTAGRELLAPLLREKPANRQALAATLLRLLETRESAPTMARHLGTHPQTIRHRCRRLRAMFGDRLDDPAEKTALILALRTLFPEHG